MKILIQFGKSPAERRREAEERRLRDEAVEILAKLVLVLIGLLLRRQVRVYHWRLYRLVRYFKRIRK